MINWSGAWPYGLDGSYISLRSKTLPRKAFRPPLLSVDFASPMSGVALKRGQKSGVALEGGKMLVLAAVLR